MLGALLSVAVAVAGADMAVPTARDGCRGVLDKTSSCTAPADEPLTVRNDEKRPAAPVPGIAPEALPEELAALSAGLLVGGSAAVAWSYASVASSDADRHTQEIARWSGAGLLAWGGLVGAGAISLAVFDPSTGVFRPKIFSESE